MKDDYKRAVYLLKLNGIRFSEEAGNKITNMELLERILEKREEIEEVAHDREKLQLIKDGILREEKDLIHELHLMFERKDY